MDGRLKKVGEGSLGAGSERDRSAQPQTVRCTLPRFFHRPVAVTDGSLREKINEIGVRVWTACSGRPCV